MQDCVKSGASVCKVAQACARYVLLPPWSTTTICHVWLQTSRKTACRVRLRYNSIARPVSSYVCFIYCYRITLTWPTSLRWQCSRPKKRTHATYSKAPKVSKSQGPVDVSPRRVLTCIQCNGGISCSDCPCIKVAPSLSNYAYGFRKSY